MSNIVFVLGAGASAQAGAPTMAKFLDVAESLLAQGKLTPGEEDQFKLVFKTIGLLQRVQSKSSLSLLNIEDIFAAFEMGSLLEKIPGMPRGDTTKPLVALE